MPTKAKRHEKYKKIGKRQEEVVQVIFEKAGMPTHVNVEEAKKGNVKELLKLSGMCTVVSTDHKYKGVISHGVLSGSPKIKSVCTCGCKQLCLVYIISVRSDESCMLVGSDCIKFLTPECLSPRFAPNKLSHGLKRKSVVRRKTATAATAAQVSLLRKLGCTEGGTLTKDAASVKIDLLLRRATHSKPATTKQLAFIAYLSCKKSVQIAQPPSSMDEASAVITRLRSM